MLTQLGCLTFAIFVLPRLMNYIPSFDPLTMIMGLFGIIAVVQHITSANLEEETGGKRGRDDGEAPSEAGRRAQQRRRGQASDYSSSRQSDSLETLLAEAQKCTEQNNWEGANKRAQKAIDLDPECAVAWEILITALKFSGKKDEAKEALNKATDIYEVSSAKLKALDKELKGQRDVQAELKELEARGEDFFGKRRFDLAVEWYTKGLDIPDVPQESRLRLLRRRAECAQQLHDFSLCRTDTTEILNLEPQDSKALLQRAISLEALEKYKLALEDARKLLALDPKNTVANRIVHSCQRELS